MLSTEKLIELRDRMIRNKDLVLLHGTWSGKVHDYISPEKHKLLCIDKTTGKEKEHPSKEVLETQLAKAIVKWNKIWDEFIRECNARSENKLPEKPKHSKAWMMMKQRDALDKWKHTLKAKRGTDPRTRPLEFFNYD